MEITAIKHKLPLETVLVNYNLKPNKNNMLLCPFHEDTKPSLQINPEANFYKCHACSKKGDQIQFVQDFGTLSKRKAILKCVAMIEISPLEPERRTGEAKSNIQNPKVEPTTITEDKSIFLKKNLPEF